MFTNLVLNKPAYCMPLNRIWILPFSLNYHNYVSHQLFKEVRVHRENDENLLNLYTLCITQSVFPYLSIDPLSYSLQIRH